MKGSLGQVESGLASLLVVVLSCPPVCLDNGRFPELSKRFLFIGYNYGLARFLAALSPKSCVVVQFVKALVVPVEMSRSRLNQLEQPKKDARISTLLRLADALNVPVTNLFAETRKKK